MADRRSRTSMKPTSMNMNVANAVADRSPRNIQGDRLDG